MDKNKNTSGGVSFCGILAVAFIALKLMGYISWPWLWVLAPIWAPVILVLMLALILSIFSK